jgi:hypothetical protein
MARLTFASSTAAGTSSANAGASFDSAKWMTAQFAGGPVSESSLGKSLPNQSLPIQSSPVPVLPVQLSSTKSSSIDGKPATRNSSSGSRKADRSEEQPSPTTPGGTLEGSIVYASASPLAALHPVQAEAAPQTIAVADFGQGKAANVATLTTSYAQSQPVTDPTSVPSSTTAANWEPGISASKHISPASAKTSAAQQAPAQDDLDDLAQSSDSSLGGSESKLASAATTTKAGRAQIPGSLNNVDQITRTPDSQSLSSADAILQASATAYSGLDPAGSAMSPASLTPSVAADGAEPARVREGGSKARSSATQSISSPGQLNDAARPAGEVQAAVGMQQGHAGGLEARPVSAGSNPAASQTTAQETFTTLDSGTSTLPSQPSWLHAGSRTAEAGFVDPSLGWVSVRAEMSGGAVHASIVPGSTDAAATLGGHMAGLNSYLGSQQSQIASLTLASPTGSDSGAGSGRMQQGTGNGAGQDGGQGANQNFTQENSTVDSRARVAFETNPAVLSANQNHPPLERMGGRISVMA